MIDINLNKVCKTFGFDMVLNNIDLTIKKGEKSTDATKLMMLMGLGVKCGDDIVVEVSGVDEENASTELEAFFKANL